MKKSHVVNKVGAPVERTPMFLSVLRAGDKSESNLLRGFRDTQRVGVSLERIRLSTRLFTNGDVKDMKGTSYQDFLKPRDILKGAYQTECGEPSLIQKDDVSDANREGHDRWSEKRHQENRSLLRGGYLNRTLMYDSVHTFTRYCTIHPGGVASSVARTDVSKVLGPLSAYMRDRFAYGFDQTRLLLGWFSWFHSGMDR